MKKMILLLSLAIILLFLNGCDNIVLPEHKTITKLQIIEEDITTDNNKVYEEFVINDGDSITLKDKQFYLCNRDANDIKIVSIQDDYVTISREMLKYDDDNVNKTYTEEVVENIYYDSEFDISINEINPLGIVCGQAKNYYYLKFVRDQFLKE